jgi:hypothetical protein
MDATAYTGLLDCVDYNIAVVGDVRAAKVKFGTGSHSVGGDFNGALNGIGNVEFEACHMTIAGDIDLRNLVTIDVESAITLIGSNDQSLYFGGSDTNPNEFGDLIIDKSGGLATLCDDWSVANFSGVRGDFDFNGFVMKVGY